MGCWAKLRAIAEESKPLRSSGTMVSNSNHCTPIFATSLVIYPRELSDSVNIHNPAGAPRLLAGSAGSVGRGSFR